jgi:poly(A) polymerase
VSAPDEISSRLAALGEWAHPVAEAFAQAGFSLYAVGGSVRDAFLGETKDDFEIDFTTNARPDDIAALMKPLCTGLWEQGRSFGTIGGLLKANGLKAEITTFRSEAYVDHSRKPAVAWGDSLESDLSRRDFTINAMAIDVIALQRMAEGQDAVDFLVDPFYGRVDLLARRLRAPIDPLVLFADDPLRLLRAARFAARLDLAIDPELEAAAAAMAPKLSIVSAERIQGELDLLMVTKKPSIGLDFLVRTGVADVFFPELSKLQLEQDPIHHHKDVLKHTWAVVDKASPRLVLRMAALFHDIGKPVTRAITPEGVTFRFHDVVGARMTRKRMTELKYSAQMIDDVSTLVELHLRFHTYKMGWSDSAVWRYMRDAGHLLADLNELTRCDCTTRNQYKAAEMAAWMDEFEERIKDVQALLDEASRRPALDGEQVMALLDLTPGRDVGAALEYLEQFGDIEQLRKGMELSLPELQRKLLDAWEFYEPVADLMKRWKCKYAGIALYYLVEEYDIDDDATDDEIEAALRPWFEERRYEDKIRPKLRLK